MRTARRLLPLLLAAVLAAGAYVPPAREAASAATSGAVPAIPAAAAAGTPCSNYGDSYPLFTGWLSNSSGTKLASSTTGSVYGRVSNVDQTWDPTHCHAYRYDAVAWRRTAAGDVAVQWGSLSGDGNPCRYVAGTADYLHANAGACPGSPTTARLVLALSPQAVYRNDAALDDVGDFAFAHSDCWTYYGATRSWTGATASPTSGRPGANCGNKALEASGSAQALAHDYTAPAATSVAIAGGATYTGSPSVYLTGIAATDAVAGVASMRFSNNGTSWSAWEQFGASRAAAWDLTNTAYGGTSADGTKTVYAQFEDANGNGPSNTVSATTTLDTTPAFPSPPDATCSGVGVWQATANDTCYFRPAAASTVALTGSSGDPQSGIAHIRFENLAPATGWTPSPALPSADSTSPYTQSLGFGPGTNSATIDVTARNGAGADTSARTVSLIADPDAPAAVITYPGASGVVAGDVDISGTATDAATFMEYQLEYGAGPAPASWTSLGTFTSGVTGGALGTWATGSLAAGPYMLRLTARDQVGHASAAQILVYVDNTRLGQDPSVTRVPFDLGGGWSLGVGVEHGDATLSRQLFSIPSYGPEQSLALTYSSADTSAGALGAGWSSNLTQRLTFESGFVVWHREDAGRVPFGQVAGTWKPLAGHFETLAPGTGADAGRYIVTLKDQTRLVFEGSGAGRLLRIDNRFGKSLTVSWGSGTATATDASGRATTVTFTGSLITGVADSAGRAWSFGYTGTDLTTITDPMSAATALAYDASHRLTSVSRSRSRVTGSPETVLWSVGYTGGRATTIVDPIANALYGAIPSVFAYSGSTTTVGLRRTYSGACSAATCNTTTYVLDDLGRATSTTDPTGAVTTWVWNADSTLASATAPAYGGATPTTTYTYDGSGDVTSLAQPVDGSTDAVTSSTWTAAGDPVDETDAVGAVTHHEYDTAGHLLSTTVDPGGLALQTSYAYGSNGLVDTEWDPYGVATRHVYDAHGNETATVVNCTSTGTTPPARGTACTGAGTRDARTNVRTERTFDAAGNLLTETVDPSDGAYTGAAQLATYTWDALGRRLTEARPGDATIPALTATTSYDQLGDVLTEDQSWPALSGVAPAGSRAQVVHVYDLRNRETSASQAGAPATTRTWDAAGGETQTTAGGVTTTRTFDGDGRVLTETVGGTATTTRVYDAAGNETSTTDPASSVTARTFDLRGSAVSETVDPGGAGLATTTGYDLAGRVVETAAAGVTTGTTYDAAGRTVATTTAGVTTATAYSPTTGAPTVTTSAPGGTTSGAGAVTTVFGPTMAVSATSLNAGATTPTYARVQDGAGNEVASVAPNGAVTRTWYNARGLAWKTVRNCTTTGTTPPSDPASCTGAGTRDGATNLTTLTWYDGAGAAVRTTADAGTSSADTATSDTAYDALGRVQAARDPLGTVTRTTYDTATGKTASTIVNCVDATAPSIWQDCSGTASADGTRNLVTTFAYDAAGNRTAVVAPNGRRTTTSYDAAGRVVRVVDNDVASPALPGEDVTTEYAYDAAGRQTAVRRPGADGSTFVVDATTYDADGRVESTIANCTVSGATPPADPAWRTCGQGGVTGTQDAATNIVTAYGYDARGNRASVTAPDPSAAAGSAATVTTRYAYDAGGRLCRVLESASVDLQGLADPCSTAVSGTTTANVSSRYGYDAAGNLTSATDAAGHTTSYAYDAMGGMTSATDPLGAVTAWSYDALGRRTLQQNRTSPPATNTVAWAHDAAGRVVSRTANGLTVAYAYDLNGNRLSASDGTETVAATYDRLSRVLTTADSLDSGAATSYAYSLASPQWTDPSGTYLVTLDRFDRAVALHDPATSAGFTWAYRADGQPSAYGQPNGNTTAYGYDAAGRPVTKTTTAAGPVTRASYAWTRNRAGQVLSEATAITGDPTSNTRTFSYDPVARLTGFTDGTATTSYGWDSVPNRTSVQAGGGPSVPTTYDAANRPLAQNGVANAFASDADGRLLTRPNADGTAYQRMTWDSLGRLTSVLPPTGSTPTATYTYDPLDRLRTADHGAAGRTRFRYVGLTASVAQAVDDATGSVIRSVGNSWAGERLEDWVPGSPSSLRVYGTNGHNDVTWAAGPSGAVTGTARYDPWGTATSVTGSMPDFRFQGSWADGATGLSWAVTRWYAPAQGRFISEDSLPGEPRDPDSRHLYAYGAGEPVGRWDPDGRASISFSSWRVTSHRLRSADFCGGVHKVDNLTTFTNRPSSWELLVAADTCTAYSSLDVELTSEARLVLGRWSGWRLGFEAANLLIQRDDGLVAGAGGAHLLIEATLLRARPLARDPYLSAIGRGTLWSQAANHVGLGWQGLGGIDLPGSFQRLTSRWHSDGFAEGPFQLSGCGRMGCQLSLKPNGNLHPFDVLQVKVHMLSEVAMIGFGSYWTDVKLDGLTAVLQPW